MKINWKVRFKNKTFTLTFLTLLTTFVYQILALCGITPAISEDAATNIIMIAVDFLCMIGVIMDPTTDGVNDSDRAMTYETDHDVRDFE